jgi:plastocyanin
MSLKNMLSKNFLLFLIIILICLALGVGVYFSLQKPPSPNLFSSPPKPSLVPKEPLNITIEIATGEIKPKTFRAHPGQKIIAKIIALDDGPHSFAFKEKGLESVWAYFSIAGRTETVEFFAPEVKGEYHFYCTLHSLDPGEEGTMIVE